MTKGLTFRAFEIPEGDVLLPQHIVDELKAHIRSGNTRLAVFVCKHNGHFDMNSPQARCILFLLIEEMCEDLRRKVLEDLD